MSGCQTSSSRHSRASHPPTPLGVPRVCSLTGSRRGATIGYMLFGTGVPRTLRRISALSILAVGLATTMLGGLRWRLIGSHRAQRLERKPRRGGRSTRSDYRRDYVPLAGLFDLKRGANTAGSAASNNIVLPKSAPAVIGRFVLDGQNVRFEPQPGAGVTLKGRPVTSGVALRSDASRGSRRTGGRGHHSVGAHQRRAAHHPHARPERRNRAVVHVDSSGFRLTTVTGSPRGSSRIPPRAR